MSEKKRKFGFLKEFKEFISRGNVMDLAVGVIIGGAFQKIVSSLVEDIMMPLIGILLNGVDFSTWGYDFKNPISDEVLVTIMYGKFISVIFNFIIMAFIVFLLVKGINKLMSLKKGEPEEVVASTKACQYCKSVIKIEATKCPHCTADLPEESNNDGA